MSTNIQKVSSCLLVCLGGKKYIPCETFADCSAAIKAYIIFNNFGSNDFHKRKNPGIVIHPIKGQIAYVSYNGRVWEGNNQIAGRKEITDLTKNDL